MYNYIFSQIGPYASFKYLDSQTSEKPNENSIMTEKWSLKMAAKTAFFLKYPVLSVFPEKIHTSELFDFRMLTSDKISQMIVCYSNTAKNNFSFSFPSF